jgi:hypothetical protein
MKNINLVFAVHNHQPIGNFEKVFEEAYERAYEPFLAIIEKYPRIRLSQHFTGPLLEWLLRRRPGFIERMKGMVSRGQLELLTGAYYEPVLAIIPEPDRLGQIRKLTDFIERTFAYRPRGMWLAERVWEQQLVESLVKAGIEFVMVDDTHFRHAGLQDDQLQGYYMTEEQGVPLKILPIDKMLRYTVPFRPIEETFHYLQRMASEDGTRVLVHADDGEKFGIWPKTFKHVYEDGWLDAFCRLLHDHRSWINSVHLGTVVDALPPQGRIYLPTASYSEMMKWALNSAAFMKLERFEEDLKNANTYDENMMFVRGGFWRNFLAKYPEANHMHKKMIRVARRARDVAGRVPLDPEIFDHIWAGQCNDAYWHGVFGGLYLPNLRYPVYQNLIAAESKLDRVESLPPLRVEEVDFDCDGLPELMVESDTCNLYFTPHLGAHLIEFDYKPIRFNLLDILSRREEGYHRRLLVGGTQEKEPATAHDSALAKEEGLAQHLSVDWYRRASLIDHFIGEGTTLEGFARCKYLELGDFVNQPYTMKVRQGASDIEIQFLREGALWFGKEPHHLTVQKTIRYVAGLPELVLDYLLTNNESTSIDIWFGVEFNIGLMAGHADDRFYLIEGRPLGENHLASSGEERNIRSWSLVDQWLGIEVAFSVRQPATLWRFPIETVSLSEGGFERLYQSSVVLPSWKLRLDETFRVQISQSVRRL